MHGLMREGWYPVAMIRLVRHRQTKGAETDRPGLRVRDACSLLYPFPLVRPNMNISRPFDGKLNSLGAGRSSGRRSISSALSVSVDHIMTRSHPIPDAGVFV